jgi:hypothetical protein
MKKLLSLALLISIVSCSKNEIDDTALNGAWTLVNVSCFCFFPDPPDFNMTQVEFSSSQNEVIITNSGESTYLMENGTYTYTGNGNRITFENGRSFNFEVEESNLQLIFIDQPNIADDEITYSFER